MPKFPKREADILALTDAMIAGYAAHGDDFPSIGGPTLFALRGYFVNARNGQAEARAAVRLATETKLHWLARLKKEMKERLAKSEVDVASDPEKLAYIGWGPKANPQPTDIPGQPTNLRVIAQGQQTVSLIWDNPTGVIRNYIIERREQPAGGGEFGDWAIAGTALNNEINLNDQPRGVQMEYRVKAANTGGESPPSNTAAVVL